MECDNRWEALLEPGKATEYFRLPEAGEGPRRRSVWSSLDPGAAGSRWDTGLAFLMAELSRLIYRRNGRPEILARAGLREERCFEVGSTQCAVVQPVTGSSVAILVLRGTADIRDWLTNLDTDEQRIRVLVSVGTVNVVVRSAIIHD